MKSYLERYWLYAAITLLVLAPLLLPGYVLTMDMVFVPHPPLPSEINASFPFYAALHYLSYLLPGDILQKLVLLAVIFGAGVGMHRLLASLPGVKLSRWAITAGALFYMLSTFVYERLMMGQFAVVAGYALLPFFAVSLQRFLRESSWRQTGWLVGWVMLIAIMSIHTLLPMFVVGLLWLFVERRHWRKFATKLAVGALASLVLASYWIVPTLMSGNTISAALAQGSSTGFATQGGLFSLLRLQGFWAEGRDLFLMPQDISPLPGVWQTLAWTVMVVGLIVAWRRYKSLAVVYGTCIVVGCLVALIGLGNAYREPHKMMLLTALGMSVFLAVGAHTWITRRAKSGTLKGLLVCAVPVLLGIGMLWGFWGQLSSRSYPPEWYALNQELKKVPDDTPVVFLPWHLYQRFSFSPRIVAHPAQTFFEGQKIVVNNDPEFAGVAPLKNDGLTSSVTKLIAQKKPLAADDLLRYEVGYVILAREPGHERYEYLRSRPGFREVFSSGRITLYKLEAL